MADERQDAKGGAQVPTEVVEVPVTQVVLTIDGVDHPIEDGKATLIGWRTKRGPVQ